MRNFRLACVRDLFAMHDFKRRWVKMVTHRGFDFSAYIAKNRQYINFSYTLNYTKFIINKKISKNVADGR